ncbi:DNA topoisomerase IV subunit A [Allofustis seminis]|uniref:DNA topoisomerase IV subunit A n=1 Tax=Allofustis seminis TaxID=166939 RepID=UPI0003636F83|nr:DNA topoisomerase IV subunit A [Allofustis seminis]
MAHQQGVQEIALEHVMGDRFGRYSKYIIQERALPDIRDGLKPVQRRILFAMNKEGNTFSKPYRKSAKTVGNVIGNYHPHGDTSVYDAMIRLSQDWKMREPLIEMHGNNGSMDGDPAAAMRYTEARLSKISDELLKDIDKETVPFVLNFDDTEYEPVVLPARFPNLLINGATGISAGYATDIPPHNLAEVIDATIHLVKHPNASLDTLMNYIKGPDFPTGGIIQGKAELKKAYETGKGRVVVRAKTRIESMKAHREMIIIDEIPYEVNKSNLVRKIDDIRLSKAIDGISEVRDESDRHGLRIVIELKRDVNAQGILNYLLKHTDLQVNYNFNMIAIDHLKPAQVGLRTIINRYIEHKREVILKRTAFLLKKAENREHIVQGLIKAVSLLDQVIHVIRASNNKSHAKINLINEFSFTEKQSEAIVTLQLYRLTNTDIIELEEEAAQLAQDISNYKEIIANKKTLDQVVITELKDIKNSYPSPRLSTIEDEITEIKIEKEVLVTEEDVIVTVTREGYLKRTSLRSYAASNSDDAGIREGDALIFVDQLNTLDQLILYTNKGNFINRYVHELKEIRWKDMGYHISHDISLAADEFILSVFAFKKLSSTEKIVFITKEGRIKQTDVTEFEAKRSHMTQSYQAIKLQSDTDEVVAIYKVDEQKHYDVFLVTREGFGLKYPLSEVSTYGLNAAGVLSINLKKGDEVISGMVIEVGQNPAYGLIVTQRGAIKKMNISSFDEIARARRGLSVLRTLKTNPHHVQLFIPLLPDEAVTITAEHNISKEVKEVELPISDRISNGSFIFDENKDGKPVSYNRKFLKIFSETESTSPE